MLALVVAAAGVTGFLLWQSSRPAKDLAPVRTVEQPVEVPLAKTEDAPRPERGRLEVPTTLPADESPGAIAAGRVRGQVDAAPGVSFPARFELRVETPGLPARVLELPGTERLVTFDIEPGRSVISA